LLRKLNSERSETTKEDPEMTNNHNLESKIIADIKAETQPKNYALHFVLTVEQYQKLWEAIPAIERHWAVSRSSYNQRLVNGLLTLRTENLRKVIYLLPRDGFKLEHYIDENTGEPKLCECHEPKATDPAISFNINLPVLLRSYWDVVEYIKEQFEEQIFIDAMNSEEFWVELERVSLEVADEIDAAEAKKKKK
jgi:hypothetical protein